MPVVIKHFVELLKATAEMIKVSTPGERFAIWHWYGRFTQGHYRPDREGKVPNNHNPKSAEIECRLQWMYIIESEKKESDITEKNFPSSVMVVIASSP